MGRFTAEKEFGGLGKPSPKIPPLPLRCLTTKSLCYLLNPISKWGKTQERGGPGRSSRRRFTAVLLHLTCVELRT